MRQKFWFITNQSLHSEKASFRQSVYSPRSWTHASILATRYFSLLADLCLGTFSRCPRLLQLFLVQPLLHDPQSFSIGLWSGLFPGHLSFAQKLGSCSRHHLLTAVIETFCLKSTSLCEKNKFGASLAPDTSPQIPSQLFLLFAITSLFKHSTIQNKERNRTYCIQFPEMGVK